MIPSIEIIVAVATNNAIGKDNNLLWRLPADMRFFKEKTITNAVIMGRKTYESIPLKFRPLPNRTNIIITRNKVFEAKGTIIVHSLDEAVDAAINAGHQRLFIAGGGEIYKQALTRANKLWVTRIHRAFDGDTFFPNFSLSNWEIKQFKTFEADTENPFAYSFVEYQR